jgi:hypothetical protein
MYPPLAKPQQADYELTMVDIFDAGKRNTIKGNLRFAIYDLRALRGPEAKRTAGRSSPGQVLV